MDRGNFILNRLFSNSVHSIRRLAAGDSEAKTISLETCLPIALAV